MNWINIHTDTLREVAFVGAEPMERATWLCLLGWCVTQENSGVIEGCKSWGSRKWQQLCGITKDEAETESELYGYEGENLVVHFYPEDHQKAVESKRANGKRGGRPKKTQGEKPCGYVSVSHVGNLDETLKKGKVKKGNGNEREKNIPLARENSNHPESALTPNDMTSIKAWINSLKPEWATPARWGYAEEHSLMGAAGQITDLTTEEQELMQDYMRAKPPKGFWQPGSRSKLAQDFADVFAHAQRWGRTRRKPKKAHTPQEQPKQDTAAEYADEIKQYKLSNGITIPDKEIIDNPDEWGKFMSWILNETIPK